MRLLVDPAAHFLQRLKKRVHRMCGYRSIAMLGLYSNVVFATTERKGVSSMCGYGSSAVPDLYCCVIFAAAEKEYYVHELVGLRVLLPGEGTCALLLCRIVSTGIQGILCRISMELFLVSVQVLSCERHYVTDVARLSYLIVFQDGQLTLAFHPCILSVPPDLSLADFWVLGKVVQ